MCSLLFTSKAIEDLGAVNRFMARRGPDHTSYTRLGDFSVVHNLLSLTGRFTPQPITSEDGNISLIYNGQIYNHVQFGDHDSDGYAILEAYSRFGLEFSAHLDGEFSIVIYDAVKHTVIIATDVFNTKPLYYSIDGSDLGVATYQSALQALGMNESRRVDRNAVLLIDLDTHKTEVRTGIRQFDISHQSKVNYEDWITAFENAIAKRVEGQNGNVFVGLSSGYDSGAICCELLRQRVSFNAYSVLGKEHADILRERQSYVNTGTGKAKRIKLSPRAFRKAKKKLVRLTEPVHYKIIRKGKIRPDDLVTNDRASVGLAVICERAKADGRSIYLSGQGADEILSDYGNAGRPIYRHSTLAGIFPKDLSEVFPWNNFFESTQYSYLLKEEYVSGAYGIEGRYPFLDFDLAQEFLWLSSDLKNCRYKAPLHEYLERHQFATDFGSKIGFDPIK